MNMNFRIRFAGLMCFIFSLAAISVFAQTPPSQSLILNQPVEREIAGGDSQFYTVNIGANQTARIEIEQKGVDVSVAAYKPNGEMFIQTESPSGVLGSELVLVTATEAGEYKISVEAANPKALLGKYVVKLAEIRPTVPLDNEINAAAVKITQVAQETSMLRTKGTRESQLQALEKFQEVIAISKVKRDKVWEVVAVISSGFVYNQLGEIQKSLDFYLRGLELAREAGVREYVGTALNNLGNSYKLIGDYEQAILYLNQALDISREVGDKAGEAITLNNLGGCYLLLDDAVKAEQTYRQSLAIRREVKDQKGEGNTLNNLGQVFAQSDDQRKAIDFLQQTLVLRRAISDKAGEAVTLQNLGKSFWKAGDKAKAFETFEQSNALGRQLGDRRVEADGFYWLAVAERDRGNMPKAVENLEKGLQIIEQIRGEIINPELRTSYFSSVQQFYELYTDLLVARYEKSKNETDSALALEISERARTRSLVELLQEARVDFKQGVDAKSIEQAQDLQIRLNTKYRQRTAALAGKPAPEQVAKLTGEINALTVEIENLQVKMRRENPRYASLTSIDSLSAKEIQNLLDDETVLLEYKLGEARSFLWLVTKDAVKVFLLPARKEIEKTAKDFYAATVSRDKTKDAQTAVLQKRLSEMLLAPVAAQIENKRLAIVADGVLQFIPFASLQVQSSKFKVQSFLIETNEIVILPSASVLAELRRNSVQTKTPEKTIAVFADPIFEAGDPRLKLSEPPAAAGGSDKAELGRVLRDFNIGEKLPRLLSSREEARNIAAFAPKNQAVSNVGFEASRENAMSANMANFQILHFATHGLLDAAHPEFSGLVFSLYDKDGKPQDGFLRLNQIYNLNLNSDLVVLSACQTALGKDVRGEGLIGLTRGFMYAGAKRVVASLWKVDDAATAEFMKRFYQNLLQKKLAPVSALRQTQNEMKKIPRFKSSYYWAGFTLQGSWK